MRSGLCRFSEIEMFWIWDVFGLAHLSVRSGNAGDGLEKESFWLRPSHLWWIPGSFASCSSSAVASEKKSLEVAQGIVTRNLIRIWELFKIACSRIDLRCFDVLPDSKRQHEPASHSLLDDLFSDLAKLICDLGTHLNVYSQFESSEFEKFFFFRWVVYSWKLCSVGLASLSYFHSQNMDWRHMV